MIDLTALQSATLPIGAKPGQVVLFVDLTETPKSIEAIETLKTMGYAPQLRFCAFATGLHIVAVLKDEQHDPAAAIDETYLEDEWLALIDRLGQNSVRLWRGHPKRKPIAA